MIRKPFWLGLILALGCLLFYVIPAFSGQANAALGPATPTPVTLSSSAIGLPAIRPSIQNAASTTATTPRFTIADARAYLQTHPFFGGRTVKGATLHIAAVQFMTSAEASALMHGAETGLPSTSIVCYAKLQGPFTLQGMPAQPGATLPSTVAYGVEIFDAQTGNLLMVWTPSA